MTLYRKDSTTSTFTANIGDFRYDVNPILPTQVNRYKVQGQGEIDLHFAVLEQAVKDLFLPVHMTRPKKVKPVDENAPYRTSARYWFAVKNIGTVSFHDVCHVLDITMTRVNDVITKCQHDLDKGRPRTKCIKAAITYLRRRCK